MAPGVCDTSAVTPSFPLPPMPTGHSTEVAHAYLLLESRARPSPGSPVKMKVVPEPSERCTTAMSIAGSFTPGFSLAIAASSHRLMRPEVDVREHLARELHLRHAFEVVDRHHRPERGGEVQDGSGRALGLLFGHRRIRGAEEHRAAAQLPDAAAGSDRLVIDPDLRVQPFVFGKPLRIERIGKRGAGAVDLPPAAWSRRRCVFSFSVPLRGVAAARGEQQERRSGRRAIRVAIPHGPMCGSSIAQARRRRRSVEPATPCTDETRMCMSTM